MLERFQRHRVQPGTELLFLWVTGRVEQVKTEVANDAALFQALHADPRHIQDVHNPTVKIGHWPLNRANPNEGHVHTRCPGQDFTGAGIILQAITVQRETGTLQHQPTYPTVGIFVEQLTNERVGVDIWPVDDWEGHQGIDREGLNGILTIHRPHHTTHRVARGQAKRRVTIEMLQEIFLGRDTNNERTQLVRDASGAGDDPDVFETLLAAGVETLLERFSYRRIRTGGAANTQELRIDDMPNRHGHFALRDITDSASRSLIKQFERLLIFLTFRSPHARPLDPPRGLGIAFIATEPIQTDPVVARQAPQMVQTRQGLALLPAIVCLGLDV